MIEFKENFSEDEVAERIQAEKIELEDLIAQMRKELGASRSLPDDLVGQLRKKVSAARSLLEGPRMGLPNELAVKMKRFIEEVEEALVKGHELIVAKQIDDAYQELIEQNPKLKKEIDAIQNTSVIPLKEFELKDLKPAGQKQVAEEKKRFSPETRSKLYVLPSEFRTMPVKFYLYIDWLVDAEKNFSNQAVFKSLPQEKQQEFSEVGRAAAEIAEKMKKLTAPDDIMVLHMANVINAWIRILGEIGVPDSQLTLGAFTTWLNSKRMGQGGGIGYYPT